jgi:hypothetical protein
MAISELGHASARQSPLLCSEDWFTKPKLADARSAFALWATADSFARFASEGW